MKPSTNGNAQPDLVKVGQEVEQTKTRTYSTPDGESFTITEEEFSKVVEIFDYLRKYRDERNAQEDALELESTPHADKSTVEERVG
jgi:hypothetical protein